MNDRVAMHLAVGGATRTVRREERQVVLDLLDVGPTHDALDAPSWDGYLALGLPDLRRVTCVEPSSMARHFDPRLTVWRARATDIPCADASFDRFGSIVGLHHLAHKRDFMREASRVLRPAGRIALCEVQIDTPVARFLNGPVNDFSISGHRGSFVAPGELSRLLVAEGFEAVGERHEQIYWHFSSDDDMATYCRGLLGLARASTKQVLDALNSSFRVERDESGVRLPWSLTYASAVRA